MEVTFKMDIPRIANGVDGRSSTSQDIKWHDAS